LFQSEQKPYQILYQEQVFCMYFRTYHCRYSQALCWYNFMVFKAVLKFLGWMLHSNFSFTFVLQTLGESPTIKSRNYHKKNAESKKACKLSLPFTKLSKLHANPPQNKNVLQNLYFHISLLLPSSYPNIKKHANIYLTRLALWAYGRNLYQVTLRPYREHFTLTCSKKVLV